MKKSYTDQIVKLGLKVKSLREESGLTQQKLADDCEVDIRTIQRIEKGEFGSGLHILFALAEALSIPVQELFED